MMNKAGIPMTGFKRLLALTLLFSGLCTCSKGESNEPRSDEVWIRVVHPPEIKDYLYRLKTAFEQSERTLAGGIKVKLTLIEENGLRAARKIATGEVKTEAWIPSSTSLVRYTNGNLKNLGPQQTDCRELFSTPVVAATLSKNLAYFGAKDAAFSWGEFLTKIRQDTAAAKSVESAVSIGMGQPEFNSSGISALMQLANFALGTVDGTLSLKHVTSPQFKARFGENLGLVAYFHPGDDEVLRRVAVSDDLRTTVALSTEQAVAQFNSRQGATGKLTALYPREGSIWQQYSICLSNADWVSPPQRAGVSLFSSFALTRAAQTAALAAGFRPAAQELLKGPEAGAMLAGQNGITVDAASSPPLPFPPDVVGTIFNVWSGFKRPAVVAVLLDTSGTISAGALFGAQKMARSIFAAAGEKDLTSLVTFSDKIQVVAEPGPDRFKATSGLTGLTPGGGSAMYQAIFEMVRLLTKDDFAGLRKNLVIFTDGKDNNSQITLVELLDFLVDRHKHYDINVHVIALATPGVDLSDLQKISEAAMGNYWRVTLGEVDRVTSDIVSRYW